MPKKKYEKLLELIDSKSTVTLETCRNTHPEISSGTFYSTMNELSKHDLVRKIAKQKGRIAYEKVNGFALEKAKQVLSSSSKQVTTSHSQTPSQVSINDEQKIRERKRRIHNLVEDYMHVLTKGERRLLNEERVKIAFVAPLLEILGWDFSDKDQDFGIDDVPSFFLEANKEARMLVEVRSPNENLDEYRTTSEGARSHAALAIQSAWSAEANWVVLTNFEETRLYNSQVNTPEEGLIWKMRFTEYESRYDELRTISKEGVLLGSLKGFQAKTEKPKDCDKVAELLKRDGPLTRRQILEKLRLGSSYQFPWYLQSLGFRRRKIYYVRGQEKEAKEKYNSMLLTKKPHLKHPTTSYPKEYFLNLLNLQRTTKAFSPASDGTPTWWERKAGKQYACSTCRRAIEKGERYIGRRKLTPGQRGIYGYRGTYTNDYHHIPCLLKEARAGIQKNIQNMQSEMGELEREIVDYRETASSKESHIMGLHNLIGKEREDYEQKSSWARIFGWFNHHYSSWSKKRQISHLEKEIDIIKDKEIPNRETQITDLKARIGRSESWLNEIETRLRELVREESIQER